MPPATETRRRSMPKDPLDHDPAAIKRARQAKGWKQAALARAAEISKSHMSEIEGGTRNAPPHLLEKFAHLLDCPVSDLERRRSAAA